MTSISVKSIFSILSFLSIYCESVTPDFNLRVTPDCISEDNSVCGGEGSGKTGSSKLYRDWRN